MCECVSCWLSASTTTTYSDLLDVDSLLVGAPREQAEDNVSANHTGGLYSCSISVDQSDCSRVKLLDAGELASASTSQCLAYECVLCVFSVVTEIFFPFQT